ncbi:hypothetical protein C8R45DRAFT_931791 [Mycena sanguinolenta]|nr:hypothetical protein C8R45DRAFT_931791 [Mycena sanguinolenta]
MYCSDSLPRIISVRGSRLDSDFPSPAHEIFRYPGRRCNPLGGPELNAFWLLSINSSQGEFGWYFGHMVQFSSSSSRSPFRHLPPQTAKYLITAIQPSSNFSRAITGKHSKWKQVRDFCCVFLSSSRFTNFSWWIQRWDDTTDDSEQEALYYLTIGLGVSLKAVKFPQGMKQTLGVVLRYSSCASILEWGLCHYLCATPRKNYHWKHLEMRICIFG